MNVDEVLEAVEKVLLSRQLTPIEQLILRRSWLGDDYREMAQDSAYSIPHLKEVGSQLWQALSAVLRQRVTKKNLHLLVNLHQQNSTGEQQNRVQELPTDTEIEHNFSDNILASETETEQKFPGGPVPLDSPLYINRPPIEELAYTEITQPGCLLRIKAPKQMGKSSLLIRILARATDVGYKTVSLDFQETDEAIFTSLDKFLRWFCANVSRQLDLKPRLDEFWDEDMGSKVSCKIYFEGYLFKKINSPLVLALNEVNRVFEHPKIALDFLPMLRFWHEQARAVDVWQKLRILVVHTTEIYIPLKLNQSPFNVGVSIRLPQFSSEQVQDLAQRYGLDWSDNVETLSPALTYRKAYASLLMEMMGGHPYLVSVALYHLRRGAMTLEALLQVAPTPSGIYSDHLRGHLAMLQDEPQLASALQQVVTADKRVQLEAIAAYKLESMGLIQMDGDRASPSCQLYRLYFRSQLGEKKEC
ncbi:AAA-like domain-containing protein [Coleofasciculus sp. FACHB-1120]|uniref:AAA-like domain-containing protein n=1 Tax=Coleofasciculus sp. FACHB-1120 TaxID=2692783 RepID=UPI00168474F3|nr:AAA-like domain-containing protein [Coleofasciculus sp. FACHB-1120]MBD2743442.1 AAA-like domain-containing protein [Coleofasciculus sp. FACHB-1120]